ncbi:MAG: HNH endonuclease signature motif containing protein, partial [Pseudonocardiaceae bacterium]
AGQLLLAGTTRRRPHRTTSCDELPPRQGGIVELQLPATLLTELAADPDACGQWAGVVADLHTQHTQHLRHGRTGLAQDPTARFAGALLRRHVEIRDRSCVYPGCRATAHSADLDHTIDHDHGGPTTTGNSGPLCRHDHRLKHVGRWRLHQPTPGHFTWTSPLGRTYHTQPPPITHDLPEPRPRPDNPDPRPLARSHDDSPILDRPPPPPDPPPAPPDPDQPPPF